jgi:hypothetical protein
MIAFRGGVLYGIPHPWRNVSARNAHENDWGTGHTNMKMQTHEQYHPMAHNHADCAGCGIGGITSKAGRGPSKMHRADQRSDEARQQANDIEITPRTRRWRSTGS